MQRPSILFINRVYPPARGASGRILYDLVHRFAQEGWDVHVLTTGRISQSETSENVHVKYIKGVERPRFDVYYLWIWLKLLVVAFMMPKTHIVVTMTDPPMTSLIGRLMARFSGMKHIHWCQDLYPDILPAIGVKLPPFMRKSLTSLSRRTMQNADKTIVIGRCMARHLSYTGLDPKKITVIPNWPVSELTDPVHHDTEFYTYIQNLQESAGSKAYEEQLKQAPKFRVLYAGTLGRAHPYKVILNAAAILAQSNPEIEFVFVGDGKGFEKLAQERTRMGLENVRLLPYQPNSGLKEVMESGDVHLISMRENAAGCLVPSKLYSALAVGRPCVFVGPEACEAAKVIEDYRAGEVIPQGDAALLAKVILQFRMNGETWFKAHEGALKAGEVFTAEASIEEWISRANDLIEDIQPPKKFQKFNKNAAGKNIESNPDKEAA